MRTVPVVLEIAERARELASDDAWIIDFTNPVGIVTRALLDAGHRAIGLCNVAINFQRQIAAHLGVPPERVLVDQVGLNHLTWIRAVWVDGRDVLPDVIERVRRRAGPRDRPAAFADRGAGRDPVLLPALLLRRARGRPGAEDDHAARPDRSRRSNAACSISTAIRRWPRSRRCSISAAGRSTAKPRSQLVASLLGRQRRRAGGRRAQRRRAARAWPTTMWSRCRRGSGRAAPCPVAQRPLAPELLGLVQHVAAYERLAASRRGARRPRGRAPGAAGTSAGPRVPAWPSTLTRAHAGAVGGPAIAVRNGVVSADGSCWRSTGAASRPTSRCSTRRSAAVTRARRAQPGLLPRGRRLRRGARGPAGRARSPRRASGRLERPFAATAQVLLAGVDLPEELSALRAPRSSG